MTRMMLTFLFVSGLVWAQAPAESPVAEVAPVEAFLSANQAYQDGEYAAAVSGYQALVDQGVAGPQVHFNLGNAWLRAGRLGEAIASYRKAEQLAPRDADVAANLAFARKNVTDALEAPGPSDIARTALFWHYALGPSERWMALVVLNLLLWPLPLPSMLRSFALAPLNAKAKLNGYAYSYQYYPYEVQH